MNQTHEYIFILGRYPELSTQEILSVLKQRSIAHSTVATSRKFIVIKTTHEIDIKDINKTLGGTVKIGKITRHISIDASSNTLENYFTSDDLFIDIFDHAEEKLTFGISFYSEDERAERQNAKILVPKFLALVKAHLEAQGFKVRFPRHVGPALSSASVEKNKLLKTGAEILLVQTTNELLIGKTLAVQEFEAFSKRDYGRPARDMESGIMPPKVARMMINLGEQPRTAKLLDPFCGSGTILQEAAFLGYTHVTGSDISEKAVTDSRNNLKWLTERDSSLIMPRVLHGDVAKLSQIFTEKSIDAIITEPFMGPNFQTTPTIQAVRQNKEELEKLYLAAWKEFAKVLRSGGVVVMILPIFHVGNQYLKIDMYDKIPALGFEQVELSPKQRHSLVIGNRYDFVLREIVKFRKV